MVESEKSLSSKESINMTDSKLNETQFNEISVQEIINNEFDNLEDWADEQINKIKKQSIDKYNKFKVDFPNENQKKDIDNNNYDNESNE